MAIYFDILPLDIINYHILPKLDSATVFIIKKVLSSCRQSCKNVCLCKLYGHMLDLKPDIYTVKCGDICKYSPNFVKYFVNMWCIDLDDVIWTSASLGNIEVLQEYSSTGSIYKFWIRVTAGAAHGGQFQVLEWIISSGHNINTGTGSDSIAEIAQIAIRKGHVSMLDFIHRTYPDFRFMMADLRHAVHNGRLDVIEYIVKISPYVDNFESIFDTAIRSDQIHIIKWVLTKLKDIERDDGSYIEAAITSGCYKSFIFLIENGFHFIMDENTFECAVDGDNMDIIKYLHDKRCPLRASTWQIILDLDKLRILKFLHEHSYTLPGDILYEAKRHYARACVKYLLSIEISGHETFQFDDSDSGEESNYSDNNEEFDYD